MKKMDGVVKNKGKYRKKHKDKIKYNQTQNILSLYLKTAIIIKYLISKSQFQNYKINLSMNPSPPPTKPAFQTPIRTSKLNPQSQSHLKGTPPPTIEPYTSSPYNDYHSTHSYSQISKNIKIKISQKPTKSYTQSNIHNNNPQSSPFSLSLAHLTNQQLILLAQSYQSQIHHLKQYLHQSDLLQRNKIIEIFGFHYNCCDNGSTHQCKLLIKELANKVKNLVNQNNVLKNKGVGSTTGQTAAGQTSPQINYDNLLIKQNQKLRMIIDEYKKTQDQQYNRMRQQVYKLQMQKQQQNEIIRKYKNRIDALQQNARYRQTKLIQSSASPSQSINKTKPAIFNKSSVSLSLSSPSAPTQSPQIQPRQKQVINNITPIKQNYNIRQQTGTINQQTQYAKKQITKQMFEIESQLKQKIMNDHQLVNNLAKKIQILQRKLQEYQKQRQFIIDNTIRKSYALSDRIMKNRGDQQIDGYPIQQQQQYYEKQKRQQGKIKQTNKLITNKHQILIKDDNYIQIQDQTPKFKRQINQQDKIIQQIMAANKDNKQMIKLLQQKLLMQQFKSKNNNDEINILKSKLLENQKKLQQKIQRNIQLQNIIMNLQKQNDKLNTDLNLNRSRLSASVLARQQQQQSEINTKDLQKQIQIIRQTLKTCKINNFQQFFKDFNQILKQRNYLSQTIKQYKIANETLNKKSKISKQKQQQLKQHTILLQKISQLSQQNKKLLKKISQLQTQLQSYHQQIISYQLLKLNDINLGNLSYPNEFTSQNALLWQTQLKDTIEISIGKLDRLEKKVNDIDRQQTIKKNVRISRKMQ